MGSICSDESLGGKSYFARAITDATMEDRLRGVCLGNGPEIPVQEVKEETGVNCTEIVREYITTDEHVKTLMYEGDRSATLFERAADAKYYTFIDGWYVPCKLAKVDMGELNRCLCCGAGGGILNFHKSGSDLADEIADKIEDGAIPYLYFVSDDDRILPLVSLNVLCGKVAIKFDRFPLFVFGEEDAPQFPMGVITPTTTSREEAQAMERLVEESLVAVILESAAGEKAHLKMTSEDIKNVAKGKNAINVCKRILQRNGVKDTSVLTALRNLEFTKIFEDWSNLKHNTDGGYSVVVGSETRYMKWSCLAMFFRLNNCVIDSITGLENGGLGTTLPGGLDSVFFSALKFGNKRNVLLLRATGNDKAMNEMKVGRYLDGIVYKTPSPHTRNEFMSDFDFCVTSRHYCSSNRYKKWKLLEHDSKGYTVFTSNGSLRVEKGSRVWKDGDAMVAADESRDWTSMTPIGDAPIKKESSATTSAAKFLV